MLTGVLTVFSLLVMAYGRDSVVIHDLSTARDLTDQTYIQSVINYWTKERMANAEPKNFVLASDLPLAAAPSSEPISEAHARSLELLIPPVAPTHPSPPIPSKLPRVAGKVFYEMYGKNYKCSGSVVVAKNRDCMMLAAHCLYDVKEETWAENVMFVPLYDDGNKPLGEWVGRKLIVPTKWIEDPEEDKNSDVGIVVMNTNDDKLHIQQVTGGLGLSFNGKKEVPVHIFGYPRNIDGGKTMSTCIGIAYAGSDVNKFYGMNVGACDMEDGASGGPWIKEYDPTSLLGYQVSLNSFRRAGRPRHVYGPYFDDEIYKLYLRCEIL